MACPIENVFKRIFDFTIEGNFTLNDYWWKIDLNDIEKYFIFKLIIFIPIVDTEKVTVHPNMRDEVIFEKQLSSGELVMLNRKLYRLVSINVEAADFFDAMKIAQQVLNNINIQLLKAIVKKVEETTEETPEEKVA